jgi:hypothetical protein
MMQRLKMVVFFVAHFIIQPGWWVKKNKRDHQWIIIP